PQSAELDAVVTGSREEPSCEQAEEARATDDGNVTLHDDSPGQWADVARNGAGGPPPQSAQPRESAARPAHTTSRRHGWPRNVTSWSSLRDARLLLQMGGRARPKL